ncbi:MAG: hypothetical protein KU28_07670 [Sulfurovum sp. PC08-66]|nr:MAG: hypothetical protein KU28_07670 [Sulfurovum sp. PC08-66]
MTIEKNVFIISSGLSIDSISSLYSLYPYLSQWSYQQDLKRRLDYKAVLDYAIEEATKEGMERGMEKGIDIGMDIGMEKGIEKGIKKGKREATLDSAVMMIKEFDLSIEQVANTLNIGMDELTKYLDK